MEKLLEILNTLKPGIDYEKETHLIEDGLLDSFDIVTLVAQLNAEFDIEFPVSEILPENFNSAKNLYAVIEKIVNE